MYEAAKAAIQPYLLLLVLQGVILAWALRRKLASRRITVPLICLWSLMVILSMPVMGRLMMSTLERSYPPLNELPPNVEAIVVLGGGLVSPDEYRSEAMVSGSSYYRCVCAAGLYQHYRCPLILCGGATEDEDTDVSEAEVMADALAFLGVDRQDMILETSSQSTRENAVRAMEVIRQRDLEHVIVVTHARHMRRADLCFRKLGAEVIPAPCSAASVPLWRAVDETWIPKSEGLDASNWAVKEWVALLYYRLRGWS